MARCPTWTSPDPHPAPLSLLWLRTIDSPFCPIPIHKLMNGATAALEVIPAGGVQSKGNAKAMLLAGATAVQVDESLRKGMFSAAVRAA